MAAFAGEGEGGSKRIESQLNLLQRSEISNPPTYGARIVRLPSPRISLRTDDVDAQVSLILNTPELFEDWKSDVKGMSERIIEMRKVLFNLLTNELKTPPVGPTGWDHILSQIGMFSFTGLNRSSSPSFPLLSR